MAWSRRARRPHRAARERADVLDGEAHLADGRHVALEAVERAAPAERDARGVARGRERRAEVLVERVEPRDGRQRPLRLLLVAVPRARRRSARARRRAGRAPGRAPRARAARDPPAGAAALTPSAVAPPTSASSERSKSKPSGGWSVATRTADAPAWVASSGPPPTSVAASIARPVTTPTCQVPVPMPATSRSAIAMPTETPIASSTARRRALARR